MRGYPEAKRGGSRTIIDGMERMKRRAFLSAAVAVAAAGCGFRPFGGFRPFTFIQMADPQLGFNAGAQGTDLAAESAVIEQAVRGINRMRPAPAFVMVCGDLTHLPGHAVQLAEYRRLMGMINPDIPIYPVPGNHDYHMDITPESVAAYRKTHGPDWYSFERNGWRFIGISSPLMQLPDKNPAETKAQDAWLEKTLAESKSARGIVVFMHHPFFDANIDEKDGYHAIGRANRRRYLDLFARYGVDTVFSGHRHKTIPEWEYKGVRLVNTNGLVRSFDQTPGLRVVRVREDGLSHTFYPPDGLPPNPETAGIRSGRMVYGRIPEPAWMG